MIHIFSIPLSAVCLIFLLGANPPSAHYTNDFERAKVGAVPDDISVLDGQFAVRQIDGNKCLELAADPIGPLGALFGPDAVEADVAARIWAAPRGKRYPEFGIGADGPGGFKLLLAPARHELELRRGDATRASVPASWKGATWTRFRLRVRHEKEKWIIEGKIWPDGQKEPPMWTLRSEDAQAPPSGRASLWGYDFSEQPIRFDDLEVTVADVSSTK